MQGIEVGPGEHLDDGAVRRVVRPAAHLVGPAGIVQGGVAAGLLVVAARAAVDRPPPLTGVDARLHRPTPAGVELETTTRRAGAGRHHVEVAHEGEVTVSGTVELAGHEEPGRVADLAGLARGPLPEPVPQHRYPVCWVCGPDNPQGLGLHPALVRDDLVRQSWWARDELADDTHPHDTNPDRVDPVAVTAVLDCPTVWSALPHLEPGGWVGYLLGGLRVQWFAPVPLHDGHRIVATPDVVDGRKLRSRSALVSEEGQVLVLASALQVAVHDLPG